MFLTRMAGKIEYTLKCSFCDEICHIEHGFWMGSELPHPKFPAGWVQLTDGYHPLSSICPKHTITVDQSVVSEGKSQ